MLKNPKKVMSMAAERIEKLIKLYISTAFYTYAKITKPKGYYIF